MKERLQLLRQRLDFERALRRAEQGDRESALTIMENLAAAGFRYPEFSLEFARTLLQVRGRRSGLLSLTQGIAPIDVREAAFGCAVRLMKENDQKFALLRADPAHGVAFSDDSLYQRALLGDLLSSRGGYAADDLSTLLNFCTNPDDTSDPEVFWRLCFALGAILSWDAVAGTTFSGNAILDEDHDLSFPRPSPASDVLEAWSQARDRTFDELAEEALLAAVVSLPPMPRGADARRAATRWWSVSLVFRRLVQLSLKQGSVDRFIGAVSAAQAYLEPAATRGSGSTPPAGPQEQVGVEQCKRALAPDGVLVQYFMFEAYEDVLVTGWVGGVGEGLSCQSLPISRMQRVMGIARHWFDPIDAASVGLEMGDEAALASLMFHEAVPEAEYAAEDEAALLAGWFEDASRAACRIVVVPWGYLHNFPVHLLPSVRRAVTEGRIKGISFQPTLRSLIESATSQRARLGAGPRCLLVHCDPTGQIDAAAELALLRRVYGEVDEVVDTTATRAAILSAASAADVVHIVAHGSYDRESREIVLQVADGQLTADTIRSERLGCELLVLNCCSSGVVSDAGAHGQGRGDSLATAFLAAGVRRVVATLWPVPDHAAIAFAETFHPAWNSRSVDVGTDEIVCEAQESLSVEYSDLFEWGSYALFGDWR